VILVPAVFLVMFAGPLAVVHVLVGRQRRAYRDFADRGVTTTGTVVRRTQSLASEEAVDVIVVEFEDDDGRKHFVRSRFGSSKMPDVGAQTRVHYFRDAPEGARLEVDRVNYDLVGKVLLATLVFVVAIGIAGGVALYWVARDYL